MPRIPCATVLVLASAVALFAQDQGQQARRGEVPASICGVSFKTTSDWVVSRNPKAPAGECRGSVRYKYYDKAIGPDTPVHFWMIGIEVFSQPLDKLADMLGIRHEGDRWFVGEGARSQPAYEIKGPGWSGLRVDGFSMRSSSRTLSSFESETTWVVATSAAGDATAFFYAGDGADGDVLALLLSTLRFDAR